MCMNLASHRALAKHGKAEQKFSSKEVQSFRDRQIYPIFPDLSPFLILLKNLH